MVLLLSGIIAAAVLLCTVGLLLQAQQESLPDRLRSMGVPDPGASDAMAIQTLEQIELSRPFTTRVVQPVLRSLARTVGRTLPGGGSDSLVLKLAAAGNPRGLTVETFLGLKVVAAISGAALGLALQFVLPPLIAPPNPVITPLWTLVAAVAGFFLPDLWIRDQTKRRQKAVRKVLPDVIDVLSISVEAGLGFDAAISRVCLKSQNPLTEELDRYLTEIRLGKPRREALRMVQARTGVDDLHTFISAVIQADQLGVSIARTLRLQSEHLRTKRRQRAEQLAQKAPLKMLFPMILFIFPSVFVVILGPAIRQLMHLGG